MKKLLLGLATIATTALPIASVVACSHKQVGQDFSKYNNEIVETLKLNKGVSLTKPIAQNKALGWGNITTEEELGRSIKLVDRGFKVLVKQGTSSACYFFDTNDKAKIKKVLDALEAKESKVGKVDHFLICSIKEIKSTVVTYSDVTTNGIVYVYEADGFKPQLGMSHTVWLFINQIILESILPTS